MTASCVVTEIINDSPWVGLSNLSIFIVKRADLQIAVVWIIVESLHYTLCAQMEMNLFNCKENKFISARSPFRLLLTMVVSLQK